MSNLLPIEERHKSIYKQPDYATSEMCRLIDTVAELGKENEKLKAKLEMAKKDIETLVFRSKCDTCLHLNNKDKCCKIGDVAFGRYPNYVWRGDAE